MGCTGRGPDGEHCCQFDGADCTFLTYLEGLARCSLFDRWGSLASDPAWQAAPVGRWFAANHPGFECRDWPQNIPDVTGALCCFEQVAA